MTTPPHVDLRFSLFWGGWWVGGTGAIVYPALYAAPSSPSRAAEPLSRTVTCSPASYWNKEKNAWNSCDLTPIPAPIPMKLGSIIMCKTVSTEPTLISIVIPILMQMGTVPNLTLISVPIRWLCNWFPLLRSNHRNHHHRFPRNHNRNRYSNRSRAM